MKIKLPDFFAILAFFIILPANAQFVFTEPAPERISIHETAEIAYVNDESLEIGQVLANDPALKFVAVPRENADLGFSDDHFWIRFTLTNKTSGDLEYYLETARPITDHAVLYSIGQDNTVITQRSGDNMPCADRSYCHRKTIFKLLIPEGQTLKYYLHLKSDGEATSLPLMLRTSESLMEITALEQIIFGIFYGILFLAAIIYLFFFFAIRERVFFYYSFYVIFIGLLQFALDGYFYQYITPGGGWFSLRSVLVFAIMATFFLGRYSQVYLNIKSYDRILNRMFDGVYVLLALLMGVLIFVPTALPICYPAANILGLLVLLLIIASLIRLRWLKVTVDRFFTVGIFFLVIGFVIFILNNFGQIPTSFFSQNASKFGTGAEVIFLSLSMANLIRKLRDEKEESNRLALSRSEEMNEMKSYFLSNISHELRTPLNAIVSIAAELSKNGDSENVRQKAQIIKYSSNSLLSSVNDILDFSKIEKGELKLEPVNFEPLKVLEHIKNNMAIRAQDQGLDFNYHKLGDFPEMISGDVNRLGQIVNNVLSNAIKFTAEGFVRFDIESKIIKGKMQLCLSVSDSGVGIPKDKLGRIFESFTQDNINNKRKFGGLGLGLYIVKTLVDMQGGKIKMESVVGLGTNCKITLIYDIVEVVKTELPVSEADFDLKGAHILVVEDNAINQMVIKMILKKWKNNTAVYSNNGQEALEAMKNEKFDIVLMDLQMPVMDGYEATTAIRNGEAGEEYKNIPIIAVTADVMETTKATVKEIGMNDYLSKPLKNEVLYEAVVKQLDNQRIT